MVQRATPALSYRENFLKIENDKKNHNTDLEEVVARKTIYIHLKDKVKEEMGE